MTFTKDSVVTAVLKAKPEAVQATQALLVASNQCCRVAHHEVPNGPSVLLVERDAGEVRIIISQPMRAMTTAEIEKLVEEATRPKPPPDVVYDSNGRC